MRTALFVPGARPDRFQRALASGADAVIIDLEDAVAAGDKLQAREHIRAFAQSWSGPGFMLRINAADTPWFADDLALCAQLPAASAVVLPKAETAAQIDAVMQACGKPVMPIVESARGVLALAVLASQPGVLRLSFGSLDLMLDLGATADTAAARGLLEDVRIRILLHSAANGLPAAIDGVYPDFADTAGLQAHARHVCELGFGGMLCIHPAQLAPIHAGFAPTPAELEWAHKVVDAADATGAAAFQLEGSMVDAPVIARARQVLARAGGPPDA
ncbi:MAG: CoA ester lyase [Castellaniella sp.]